MRKYAVDYFSSSEEQSTCITYHKSIADAILKDYDAPLTGHQMRTRIIYGGKVTEYFFHHLKLKPLLSALEDAEGSYAIETLEGHLIHAKIGNALLLAE